MGRATLVFIFIFPAALTFAQLPAFIKKGSILPGQAQRMGTVVGKPFPSFSAGLNDSLITDEDFKGKTVFINFWFESCAPCVAEFDGLNELYAKTKDNRRFAFVTFTFEKPERIKEIRTKYGITYPVLSVSQEECNRLNQRMGFPTSMLLNEQGKICYAFSGGVTDKKQASQWVMEELYVRITEQLND